MTSLASQPKFRRSPARLVLGWREWVALPELGVSSIRAKVDSGARSSSLHVLRQEVFERDGLALVRFLLEHGPGEQLSRELEAPIADRRDVTDSGGHREHRVFITTLLRLPGGQSWPIELNLTQRRNMAFPMLLGRSALRRRCLVEPARSWLLGVPHTPSSTE